MSKKAIRIIGIDPGLHKTGWGIIESTASQSSFIACGTIKTSPKATMPIRLETLHNELTAVIKRYHPQESAIEETFVNKNPLSSLKLSHARGALILTLALAKLPVNEYSATNIKKSVVGVGRAEKSQVEMMVKILLPLAVIDGADAADALAVALCHAHHRTINKMVIS